MCFGHTLVVTTGLILLELPYWCCLTPQRTTRWQQRCKITLLPSSCHPDCCSTTIYTIYLLNFQIYSYINVDLAIQCISSVNTKKLNCNSFQIYHMVIVQNFSSIDSCSNLKKDKNIFQLLRGSRNYNSQRSSTEFWELQFRYIQIQAFTMFLVVIWF